MRANRYTAMSFSTPLRAEELTKRGNKQEKRQEKSPFVSQASVKGCLPAITTADCHHVIQKAAQHALPHL